MKKYFSVRGYQCLRFNYPTRTESITDNAKSLQYWLTEQKLTEVNFICHSMGGLVCRAYFQNQTGLKTRASVVCLGPPFQGSVVAQNLSVNKLGAKLLGTQTKSELVSGMNGWPSNSNLGVIAGNKNIGAGRLLGLPNDREGDGTILVNETRIEGATDHIILPVTHTQMTFSNLVAEQAEHFIKHQRFNHSHDRY